MSFEEDSHSIDLDKTPSVVHAEQEDSLYEDSCLSSETPLDSFENDLNPNLQSSSDSSKDNGISVQQGLEEGEYVSMGFTSIPVFDSDLQQSSSLNESQENHNVFD